MNIIIGGKEYYFSKEIRNDPSIRKSFNELAMKIHGINFEDWYKNGYWKEDYIPYVLMDGNEVVSNVSVNIMHMNYKSKEFFFIQLGTVMTHKAYRNLGLIRWLIKKVLEDWQHKCDAVYLFANNTVLNFYPKFNFEKRQEYEAIGKFTSKKLQTRKLNMNSLCDIKLLYEKYSLSNPFSDLTMKNNTGLLMFYCSQYMKNNIYYIPKYNLAVILEESHGKLICYDIFGKTDASLIDVLSSLVKEDTQVTLGFTPKDKNPFCFKKVNADDTTLFWLSKKEDIFLDANMLMFPLLSHA